MADYSPTAPGSPAGSYQDNSSPRGHSRSRSRSPRRPPRPIRERKLYISNFPYDMNWKDVKSLFRDHVGDCFVSMYEKSNGKSMGAGLVEFRDLRKAQEAADKLNRYEINGRRVIVREESDRDRVRHAQDRLTNTENRKSGGTGGSGPVRSSGPGRSSGPIRSSGLGRSSGQSLPMVLPPGVTYQLLDQLGINEGPITKQVFVANLNYKCTEEKLREIFALAGRIEKIEMRSGKDGGFRGIAIINFETHLEALNSISMFNNQMLFDRTMTVKMDKLAEKEEKSALPEGLQSIGTSLSSLGAVKNGGADAGLSVDSGLGSSALSGGTGDQTSGLGIGGNSHIPDQLSYMPSLGGGGQNNPEAFNALSALMTQMVQASSGLGLGSSLTLPSPDLDRYDSGRSSFGARRSSRWDQLDEEPCAVFVRNMPFTYTWQMLKEAFRVVGNVEYAEIKTDDDGKSRGFGTVRFSSHEEAKRAVNQFNRSKVNGREIEVRLNYPRGTRPT